MTAVESRPEPVTDAEFAELLGPLVRKIAGEMRKERGAELLADPFLYALACRAAVAAGAYMGDPRSIVQSVVTDPCPGCGEPQYRRGEGGRSCVHAAGCKGRGGGL